MQVAINSATRVIVAYGDAPSPSAGVVVEAVTPDVWAKIVAALAQVVGDGGVVLSADHTSVTVGAPSAQWTAQRTAKATLATLRAQHIGALNALQAQLVGNAATVSADITALQNLVASIEAGTQPTGAQLLEVVRFLLRAVAVLQ